MRYVFLLFTLLGCSINQVSKDYYSYRKTLRHGLIPLAKTPNNKNQNYKIDLSEKSISMGRALYVKNCKMCHGNEAKGNGPKAANFYPPPRDLVNVINEVPNFKFYLSVSKWQNTMPGWVNPLTEDEIKYIEAYLVSLSKKDRS